MSWIVNPEEWLAASDVFHASEDGRWCFCYPLCFFKCYGRNDPEHQCD